MMLLKVIDDLDDVMLTVLKHHQLMVSVEQLVEWSIMDRIFLPDDQLLCVQLERLVVLLDLIRVEIIVGLVWD